MTTIPPKKLVPEEGRRSASQTREFAKEQWTAFVAALQFLTIVPPLVRRLFSNAELGSSVTYFPVVGLLLGFMLAIVNVLLRRLLPIEVATVLTLSVWVLLTGALHMDGFLDSCDGLWGGRTPDERLSIMRDHRVGAYAAIGGILLILLKFAVIARLQQPAAAIVIACVTGRWLICWAIILFPYGRTQGLGRVIKDFAFRQHGVWATVIALVAVIVISPFWGLTAFGFATLVGLLIARFSLKRLPGLTGDIYGAVCELGEATVLVVWSACEKGAL